MSSLSSLSSSQRWIVFARSTTCKTSHQLSPAVRRSGDFRCILWTGRRGYYIAAGAAGSTAGARAGSTASAGAGSASPIIAIAPRYPVSVVPSSLDRTRTATSLAVGLCAAPCSAASCSAASADASVLGSRPAGPFSGTTTNNNNSRLLLLVSTMMGMGIGMRMFQQTTNNSTQCEAAAVADATATANVDSNSYSHSDSANENNNGKHLLPSFGSSSDPMLSIPLPGEVGYEDHLVLQRLISNNNVQQQEMDPNSDWNQSLRAFSMFVNNKNQTLEPTQTEQQQPEQQPEPQHEAKMEMEVKTEIQVGVVATASTSDATTTTYYQLVESSQIQNALARQKRATDRVDAMMTMQKHTTQQDPQQQKQQPARTTTNHVTTDKMYFYHAPQIQPWKADKFILLAGPSSTDLGHDMAHLLGVPLSGLTVAPYADGETSVQVQDSVRGKHVFVVQATPSNESVMELLLTIAALRRASCKTITAVVPYYGYCRQDQRRIREPIAAADVAMLLEEMGVDRVLCLDLHNDSLRGFFKCTTPVEHLMPAPVAAAYFHDEILRELRQQQQQQQQDEQPHDSGSTTIQKQPYPRVTVVASHEGQVGRASHVRSALQRLSGQSIELAVLSKNKLLPGETHYTPTLVGNVRGRRCILVDDICNTGTTLVSNIQTLHKEGAASIYAWATHGIFGTASQAPERLQALKELEYLLISNSVQNERPLPPKIRSLNVAPLLAEAVARALHDQSISAILDLEVLEQAQGRHDSRYDS